MSQMPSSVRVMLLVVLPTLLANPVSSSVPAQELDAETMECLDCHGAAPGDTDGLRIDAFANSVHAEPGCMLCHTDGYDELPHEADPQADDCTACHDDGDPPYHFSWIANDVRASVHGRIVSEDFACAKCHDPHSILPVHRAPNVRQAIAEANRFCLDCHGQDGDSAPDEPHSLAQLEQTHAFLPQMKRHAEAAQCVECHTPGREQTVHLILSAKSAVRDCVECHTQNSAMLEKFYRHMAAQERQGKFVDALIQNNYYMVGVTRNQRMESALWVLFGVTLVGICVHGGIRLAGRRRRS